MQEDRCYKIPRLQLNSVCWIIYRGRVRRERPQKDRDSRKAKEEENAGRQRLKNTKALF
jgi:hypothetical protein